MSYVSSDYCNGGLSADVFPDVAPEEVVLAAEELRYAAQAVGRVTGEIGSEDVLDALFRDFCIGK